MCGLVPFRFTTPQAPSSRLKSVLLPEVVDGVKSELAPITDVEVSGLPKDTTFGRRRYMVGDNFEPLVSAVLMGADRTSIHDPHFCLPGAGWTIDQTERVLLPIKRPYSYNLPVIKVTTSRLVPGENNQSMMVRGFYVYWFVTADKITADQGTRLWSIAKTMVEKRELERWAYISYFVPCLAGSEEATFDRLKQFIENRRQNSKWLRASQPEGARRSLSSNDSNHFRISYAIRQAIIFGLSHVAPHPPTPCAGLPNHGRGYFHTCAGLAHHLRAILYDLPFFKDPITPVKQDYFDAVSGNDSDGCR